MCDIKTYPQNCTNCARASKQLDDDQGHCRVCILADKTKPFSKWQKRGTTCSPAN